MDDSFETSMGESDLNCDVGVCPNGACVWRKLMGEIAIQQFGHTQSRRCDSSTIYELVNGEQHGSEIVSGDMVPRKAHTWVSTTTGNFVATACKMDN